MVEDEAKPAAFAGGKGKAARRRKVGLGAADLGNHGRHGTAFERFLHGPQRIARTRHAQDDKTRHGKAKEIESGPVEGARFGGNEIGLDPDRVLAIVERQGRECCRKPSRRAAMERGRRRDFMQGPARETAFKRSVDGGNAKRYEPAARIRRGRQIGYGAPQVVEGFGRFGEHDRAQRAGFPRGKRCLFLVCSIFLQPLSDVKN
jgi:hypothetical protein